MSKKDEWAVSLSDLGGWGTCHLKKKKKKERKRTQGPSSMSPFSSKNKVSNNTICVFVWTKKKVWKDYLKEKVLQKADER
jgi:hypothetical protein